jgi:hypothetical protein
MHGSIRDRLEDLLAGRPSVAGNREVTEHFDSCPNCLSEFSELKAQSGLLKTLRAAEEIEPAPGFYARVMQRIEERAKDSIWAPLIYSRFAMRFAYASLTVALALGSYVVASESRDGHLRPEQVAVQEVHYDTLVIGDPAQQRDAVLANFASHSGLRQDSLQSVSLEQGSLQ